MWTQALSVFAVVAIGGLCTDDPEPAALDATPQLAVPAAATVSDPSAIISTRAIWPLNTPLYIAINHGKLADSKSHDVHIQMKLKGAPKIEKFILPTHIWATPLPDMTWRDDRYLAGNVTSPCSSVSFEFKRTNPEGVDPIAPPAPKSPLILPVKVQGTVDDVLSGVKVPELDAALQTQLNATFYRRGWVSDDKPRLWVGTYTNCEGIQGTKYPGICHVLKAHPNTTFAARFEVLHNSVVVASSRAWWRGTEYNVHPYEGKLAVEVQLKDFHKLPLKDGLWSLRIRSDPETALRDFESNRYWLGDVTVSLKVTDSNDWESLKANGELKEP